VLTGSARTVAAFYQAVEDGELARAARLLGPEIVWYPGSGTPYDGAWGGYLGGAEVADHVLARMVSEIAGLRFDRREVFDYGDSIAVVGTYRGTTRGADSPVAIPFLHAWVFADAKVVEVREYVDARSMTAALTAGYFFPVP
jgi:ketosteroid isomerase-like protein